VDGVKIREIGGFFEDFGVADNPLFVHNKCGAFGYPVHVKYEIIVEGAVGGGNGFVEIAEEGKIKVLVFFVFSQGENRVYADAQDLGVSLVIESDIIARAAKFFCAGTGECLGEEKDKNILSGEVAQGYLLFVRII
jgi:hypothetical protein